MPATDPELGEIGRRQLLGAIRVPIGQEFPNVAMYLAFLADRVQEMIEREEDPQAALDYTTGWLESEGLMSQMPHSLEEAGWSLVMENPALRMRLGMLDVPGELPEKITAGDATALKLVEETTLENWVVQLVCGFNEGLT
jgi:hypothetical protein